MVWNGKTTMELRSEFVRLANQPGVNISQLCRQFEITRKTAYKWISRAQSGETCADRSRRPKYHPNTTTPDVESLIVKTRKKFPSWGGRKLHAWLARQGYRGLPAPSTITAILRRNNLLNESISNNSKAWQRFEHERPNQLWQMDFKGHFAMGKGRCHPLTILDDCSRFSLALEACKNERRTTVEEKLQLIFKRYGLPERFNLDNGPPCGSSGTGSLTRLTVW
jgi:transposase InsO family protein